MGASYSRPPAAHKPMHVQISEDQHPISNEVRRDSEQEYHEHSGRSNKVNPITVEGLSLEEAANGVNTDERTEPLPSTCINEKNNIEACQDEAQTPDEVTKIVNSPCVDVEEEICPICLEEYSAENPKLITQCKHDYHLSCILEWMNRSITCPVCSKETLLDDCTIIGF